MSKKKTSAKNVSNKKISGKVFGVTRTILKYVFGFMCITLSLVFLYGLPFPQPNATRNPISIDKNFQGNAQSKQKAQRIIIPRTKIDLSIVEAPIVNGYWTLSETTASHGEGSAGPGEKGNMVIFAHAREGLFYNLKDIKKDDVIYVLTEKTWKEYKVKQVKTVYPNETQVIKPTKSEILTLFTCSGFYDEKRLIVQAVPNK